MTVGDVVGVFVSDSVGDDDVELVVGIRTSEGTDVVGTFVG